MSVAPPQQKNDPAATARGAALPPLPADADGRFAGQLQVLGLAGLRKHLGGQWEKYRATIHIAIENIISTHIGPRDLSTLIGDDHYLIVFAEDDAARAEQTSHEIAQAIREILVGESHSELVNVRTQVGRIQRTELNELVLDPLPDRDGTSDGKAAPQTGADAADAKPAPRADKLESAMQDVSRAEARRRAMYEVGYSPFWNIHREILTGYAVMPFTRKAVGSTVMEHNVLRAGASPADYRTLDAKMLQTQIEVAAELYQNDFTSLLISQIHFDTLSAADGREEVMKIARQIPDFLKQTLMIEIVGIPDNTPPSTVAQRTAGLKNFFRALTVRVPRLDYPMQDCVAMGATAVAYAVPKKFDPIALLTGAKKLILGARKAKLMTSFEYVPSADLASALKDAGAVFVSGDFLGGPFDTPGNAKKVTLKQVRLGPISPY